MVLQSGSLPEGGTSPAFLEIPVNNDRESIIANITQNIGRGLPELTQHAWRSRPLLVVGGGPSLADYLHVIKAYRPDCDVLAINGAYKYLRSHGVEADYFVLIDSRAENVVHVDGASFRTQHYLASQVHPRVFDALENRRVTTFHLGTQTARDAITGNFSFLTAPIGMASVHAIYVGAALGYKQQWLFGYDFSQSDTPYAFPQPMNAGDQPIEIPLDGKVYKTTFALARTAEMFVRAVSPVMRQCELDLKLYSDGLLAAMLAKASADIPLEQSEREKYEAMWAIEKYSECSPALWYVNSAIELLEMPRGSTVLDLGCGTGRSVARFNELGFKATGIDIAGNSLTEVIPFVQQPLWERLPSADYGFSVDVLEHIPQSKVLDTLQAIHDACSVGCYLNIDTVHDSYGILIGQQLHMTVMDGDEWYKVLKTIWSDVDYYPGERQAVFVGRR